MPIGGPLVGRASIAPGGKADNEAGGVWRCPIGVLEKPVRSAAFHSRRLVIDLAALFHRNWTKKTFTI
jgi:hypothetical protein